MHTYDQETIDGFVVKYLYDTDADAPWDNCTGRGPVRKSLSPHTEHRSDKRPGERPLNSPDRNEYQYYYDWQTACKEAKRDGWDAAPFGESHHVHRAVKADFAYLRGYVQNDWIYVGVCIEDSNGNVLDTLWGVETHKDYHRTCAREMVAACVDTRLVAQRAARRESRERNYWASRDVVTVCGG